VLIEDPRPHGVKKLKAELDLYRSRAGDYRIVYAIDDHTKVIDIVRIRHRSKAYE
jgi:mRNA interferase RelE/StbE